MRGPVTTSARRSGTRSRATGSDSSGAVQERGTDARAADGDDAQRLVAVAERRAIDGRARVEARDVAGEPVVALRPLADDREVRAEARVDHVLRVADEDRAVADAREALDVLDHLRVVVGRDERLALAAGGHRQEADEVREPRERRGLALGVLVQEVVDLPGLVGDPDVERLLVDEVVEDHVVRAQDLVHAPDRLERVQVVLAGLAIDVRRLACELGARGVDRLSAVLEDGRHRRLGEPVDLEVRHTRTQRIRDRDVAPRVAEPDRRRDVQRALGP
jgi:hypothetical protein